LCRHRRCHALSKKTFQRAAQAGCRLIAQVKSNQPGLLAAIIQLSRDKAPSQRHESLDKARSRHEERRTEVFAVGDALAGSGWHGLIKSVIRVERDRLDRSAKTGLWKASSEITYHVADFEPTATDAAHAIRRHWGIENRLHYTRDVTMREDASRVRKNPGIMARIRSFAANILRANKVTNMADTRFRNALGGIDHLAGYTFM
jgi:predicted transposase YbfD/YdcC